jgi:hypothetical protein
MTKGEHYVEAIDLLLDSELHRIQQARDENIASKIAHLVEPFGINPHSRRLAGAFRSTKTTDKDAAEQNRIKVFQERFPELKTLDESKLADLINTLEKLMTPADVELYSERTKLSTVSTVIRPVSTKWLERWRTQRTDGFDYETALKAANELLEAEISSDDVADVWFQKVFDLFTDLVVFRINRNEVVRMNTRRPIGMVSEANERIYRRNWAEFVGKYKQTIQSNAESLAAGNRTSAYSSSYRRKVDPNQLNAYLEQPMSYGSVYSQPSSTAPIKPEAIFSVTVESPTDPSANASKTWGSRDDLLSEFGPWLARLGKAWGETASLVHVTLDAKGTGDDGVVKIPNKTITQAEIALKDFLT